MFRLTREPINEPDWSLPEAGGYVSFVGRVRDSDKGQRVTALEYEAYDELALNEGEALLAEAAARFGASRITCTHRVGLLGIGEIAVKIQVAAPHRREAFAACQFVIDELKRRVPIWKKDLFEDATPKWRESAPVAPNLFDRQTRLPEVGTEGQEKLGKAKILVVGLGGLGCPAAQYLAAAGVGTLGLCDGDTVAADNLHRQTLYGVNDVGLTKASVATTRLSTLYPHVACQTHPFRFQRGRESLLDRYDLVLDCTDNFAAKFLLNDACVSAGKPLVQASIYRFEGSAMVIQPGGPCLRCQYPEAPPPGCVGSCEEVGVLGFVPGIFGTLQAAEAIKLVLGIPSPLTSSTMLFDLRDWSVQTLKREKAPNCPSCSGSATAKPTMIDLTYQEALAIENAAWIDVREPFEVQQNPGPLEIAFKRIPMGQLGEIPEGPVIFVCAHGVRSGNCARKYRSRGREDVYSLEGGLAAL